jgi:hypothetical protein
MLNGDADTTSQSGLGVLVNDAHAGEAAPTAAAARDSAATDLALSYDPLHCQGKYGYPMRSLPATGSGAALLHCRQTTRDCPATLR